MDSPKFSLLCTLALLLSLAPARTEAQIDPRIKTLISVTAYGLVGGALLGTASLAFYSEGRAPFIGASLGLYAGLLFGGYIVTSHAYKNYRRNNPQSQENYYPDTQSLYENVGESGTGDTYAPGGEYYEYWAPFGGARSRRGGIPLYINLLRIQF